MKSKVKKNKSSPGPAMEKLPKVRAEKPLSIEKAVPSDVELFLAGGLDALRNKVRMELMNELPMSLHLFGIRMSDCVSIVAAVRRKLSKPTPSGQALRDELAVLLREPSINEPADLRWGQPPIAPSKPKE